MRDDTDLVMGGGVPDPPKRPRLNILLTGHTSVELTLPKNIQSHHISNNATESICDFITCEDNPFVSSFAIISPPSPKRACSMRAAQTASQTAGGSSCGDNSRGVTYAKMQVLPSPKLRMRDIFRALLKTVPEGTSIFETLVSHADSLGATAIKFLINDKRYDCKSLINPVYQRYQGPALYAYFDCVLDEQQWDQMLHFQHTSPCLAESSVKLKPSSILNAPHQHVSQFLSIFTLSDFAVISSGKKMAFIDPSERLSADERTFVAFFDLDTDLKETRLLADQFAPLLNGPMVNLGIKSSNRGTMIRLPLRSSLHSDSLSSELHTVDGLSQKALEFSKVLAELSLLFCRNIRFIVAKESTGKAYEQLFSLELSQQPLNNSNLHVSSSDQQSNCMRKLLYTVIEGAIANDELPSYGLSVLRVTRSLHDGSYHKNDWILCARCAQLDESADHPTSISTLFLVMPLHQPSRQSQANCLDFCDEADSLVIRGFKPNGSVCRSFYFNRRPVICSLVTTDTENDHHIRERFNQLPISCALRLVKFVELYEYLCKELVNVFRKHCLQCQQDIHHHLNKQTDCISKTSSVSSSLLNKYISIVYSLLPDNDQIKKEAALGDIAIQLWTHLGKHELFYSATDGWGFVSAKDMLLIKGIQHMKLRSTLINLLQSCNAPVVDVPDKLSDGLDHFYSLSHRSSGPAEVSFVGKQPQLVDADLFCQIIRRSMLATSESRLDEEDSSPISQKSSPLHALFNSLDQQIRILLLDYILINSTNPAESVLNLPILHLANGTFIPFTRCHQGDPSTSSSVVYLVDPQDIAIFNKPDIKRKLVCVQGLSEEAIAVMKSVAISEATQVQTMSGQDFSQLVMLPREWQKGDFVVTWPKHHQYFNLLWLENIWKYIREKMPKDLSPIENFNLIYVNNHRERYITIYKLTQNQSTLMHCSKECLLNPNMNALQRTLAKLDIAVIDGFPDVITGHADFSRYVPHFNPAGLLRILVCRLRERGSLTKLANSINSLLSDKEICNIRSFLSQLSSSDLNATDHLECLKQLPLFDNATYESRDKYISVSQSSGLFYENGPKLPCTSACTANRTTGTGNGHLLSGSAPPGGGSTSRSLLNYGQGLTRPSIHVGDTPSKKMLELLGYRPVEFSVAARQIIMSISDNVINKRNSGATMINMTNPLSNGSRSVSPLRADKNGVNDVNLSIANVGRWLLTNCSRLILTDSACQESIRPLHIFQNQAGELCSAHQLIDPASSERFKYIVGNRFTPCSDLRNEPFLGLLRSLGMRSIYDLHGDELIEICQSAHHNSVTSHQQAKLRHLLTQLIILIVNGSNGKSLMNEPVFINTGVRCSVKVFLSSFAWVPVASTRPHGYPRSLQWMYDHYVSSNVDCSGLERGSGALFMPPNEILDKRDSLIGGSEQLISELDIRSEHLSKIGFKKCGIDTIVKHLRHIITGYVKMKDRTEYLEYLTLTKGCYEALQKLDFILVQAELHSVNLKEWIWNGSGGFSAPESIFLLEKSHLLSHFFTVVPYEMYSFNGFFELMGVRRHPSVPVLLELFANESFQFEFSRISVDSQVAFLGWIQETFNDRRITHALNQLERKGSASKSVVHWSDPVDCNSNKSDSFGLHVPRAQAFPPVENASIDQDKQERVDSDHPSPACKRSARGDAKSSSCKQSTGPSNASSIRLITLWLPYTLVKDQPGIVETFRFAVTSVVKSHELVVKCGSGSGSSGEAPLEFVAQISQELGSNSPIDHYKLYDEILLPNLNVFSRNVKDTIVLFALDHCDIEMKCVLKRHLCIPVTPNGHTLRRPGRLIHPKCILSIMYADVEGFFPYGSEDTYLREDRLNVLRLLGMKFEEVSWPELCERAELVTNIKDSQFAQQRACGVITVLRIMLSHQLSGSINRDDFANSSDDELNKACHTLSTCPFYPTMAKPSTQYCMRWADKCLPNRLAKPCDLVENRHWKIASASYPVCFSEETTGLEVDLLNFHKPTVADCLNQLQEISRLPTPLTEDVLEDGRVIEVANACYSFIVKCSKQSDFNQTSVMDFFARNRVLLSSGNLYFSNQIFSDISQSVPPYFISLACSGLPLSLMRSVLAIADKPTINQLFSYIRIGASNCGGRTNGIFWASQLILFNLVGDMIDIATSHDSAAIQIPDDLPVPDNEGVMHPLFQFKQSTNQKAIVLVHPAIDHRFLKHAEISSPTIGINGELISSPIPHALSAELRAILCKIDHFSIDPHLRDALSERDASIILEFIIAAERIHSIDQYLTPRNADVLLSYFNDQLRLNDGNFQKLRELRLFRNVWPPMEMNSRNLCSELSSIDQYKQIFLVSIPMAHLLTLLFSSCPLNDPCRSRSARSSFSLIDDCCVLTHWYNSYCDNCSKNRDNHFETSKSLILNHLHIHTLSDTDAMLQLCFPYLDNLSNDYNKVLQALHYLYSYVWPTLADDEKQRVQHIIKSQLHLPNRENPALFVSCFKLYNPQYASFLSFCLNANADFPNIAFKSVYDLLPISKVIPADKLLALAKGIELEVAKSGAWTSKLRYQSHCLYRLLVQCKDQRDELDAAGVNFRSIPFLEPYIYQSCLAAKTVPIFESSVAHKSVLSLADGISHQYAQLSWSTSFILPEFVDAQFSRYLSPQLVIRHLFNISQSMSNIGVTDNHQAANEGFSTTSSYKTHTTVSQFQSEFRVRRDLLETVKSIYQYIDDCIEGRHGGEGDDRSANQAGDYHSWSPSEILDELHSKPIVYTESTNQLICPQKVVLHLHAEDEVPPFLFTVPRDILACDKCIHLLNRLGCQDRLQTATLAKIMSQMARVCQSDYLNSNEVCKVLKLARLLFQSIEEYKPETPNQFDGLFLLSGQLKLMKSSDVLVMDQRHHMDYMVKLPNEHFLFNPNEVVLSLDPIDCCRQNCAVRPASIACLEGIARSQRPILFSERYEQTFSVVVPDDPQRQRVLHALERKFVQLLNSRTLHRCLARMLADAMARSKSDMRIVNIDEMEMLLRSRMSLVRVICCEHLETNLVNKRANKAVDDTVEERAVLLTNCQQTNQDMRNSDQQHVFVLHISFKHAEQTYFNACLSKALLPLFNDVKHHFDSSILSSLISCGIAHMSKLLDLLGLCTDETILSTLKLNYVPDAGRLYGDEACLLSPYSRDIHQLTIGDLCVFKRSMDSALVYCRFLRLGPSNNVFILADQERLSIAGNSALHTGDVNDEENVVTATGDKGANSFSSLTGRFGGETEIRISDLYVLENWSRMYEAVNVIPFSEQEYDRQQHQADDGGCAEDISNGYSSSSCTITASLTEEEREMLDNAKLLVDSELREVYALFCTSAPSSNIAEEKKKRIKRLLLKWHPDKNQGNEKFASEVFKHVKKQVELLDIETPLNSSSLGSFTSLFNNFNWSGNNSAFSNRFSANGAPKEGMFNSPKFGGSFDNLHTAAGADVGSGSDQSQQQPSFHRYSPSFQTADDTTSQFTTSGQQNMPRSRSGTTTPPSRSNSFRSAREEWQWRRMQGFGRRTGLFSNNTNNDDPGVASQGYGNTNGSASAFTGNHNADERKSHWAYGTNVQTDMGSNGNNPPPGGIGHHYQSQQQATESQRWLKQSLIDLNSANNDLCPLPPGSPAYEWVCYKCYRAAEKALKAYHLNRCPGKMLASDIPTLLFGVDSDVRSIGYRLYKWLGDPNKMHYPNLARFSKIPNEIFTITQAEKSLEYCRELVRKIEQVLSKPSSTP